MRRSRQRSERSSAFAVHLGAGSITRSWYHDRRIRHRGFGLDDGLRLADKSRHGDGDDDDEWKELTLCEKRRELQPLR